MSVFVTSSSLDLSGFTSLILFVDIRRDTEAGWDGVRIEYSTDGTNWFVLGAVGSGTNWYNDTDVDAIAIGADGWSGNNGGWATSSINLPATLEISTAQFRFFFASDGSITDNGFGFDDFIIQGISISPMTFSNSRATQDNTMSVIFNASDAEVIALEVETSGSANPIDVTEIKINMTGTTNLSDVTSIHIYYTGTTNTFSASNEFGGSGTSPAAGTITFTGTQTLASGLNYFWIAYDLNGTAGNFIDAEATSVTVDGTARIPAVTAPSGNRLIFNSPGGISSNLALWLRADVETNTTSDGASISTWGDQSTNGNDGSQATSNRQPLYRAISLNYNPSVDFDGSNDRIEGSAGGYSLSYFVVIASDATISSSSGAGTVFAYNSPSSGSNFAGLGVGPNTGSFTNEVITHLVGGQTEWRSAQTGSGSYAVSEPLIIHVTDNIGGTSSNIFVNGLQVDNATNSTIQSVTGNTSYVVASDNLSSPFSPLFYDGLIAEVITYSSRVANTNKSFITSYLALKYGITLDQSTAQDYFASDGSTIYPASSTHDSYDNDIAGIGLNGTSGLNQKQSLSENNDAIVTMGLGSVESSNALNTNTFSMDLSFLIWGNDNGSTTLSATIDNADGMGTSNRLGRVWRVAESGTVGTVQISIPSTTGGGTLQSLVIHNNNPSFPNDADRTVKDLTSDGAGNLVATVDFADNQYFSFADAGSSVLPIELIFFEAKPLGNEVRLSWATASETNNDLFTIERTPDLQEWDIVTTTPGAGDSNIRLDYHAFDTEPYLGVSYYRLKQTDFDGRFSYSEIQGIVYNEANIITLFPNPAQDFIIINSGKPIEENQIRLWNSLGQEITISKNKLSVRRIKLNTDPLSPGLYLLQISNVDGVVKRKVIIDSNPLH